MSQHRIPAASRARPAEGLALCVFGLTVTLCVVFATGAAPFVKAWMLGVLAW